MHYRDVLAIHRNAQRFKRWAMWSAVLLCFILLFSKNTWYLTGVPPQSSFH
ncbi:hypothetical protein HP436_10165 [Pseudomonas sp. CrR14]|nr:hypothetical protein [Pseudomonas sp. CrR14]